MLYFILFCFQRATCHPPIFLLVVDTCFPEDEDLQGLKASDFFSFTLVCFAKKKKKVTT